MRAYLSVPKCSGARVLLSGFPPNRELEAQAAESEARRILADVEPHEAWRERSLGFPCYLTAREADLSPWNEASALRDSLTAFLAASDPAAYLRSKQ